MKSSSAATRLKQKQEQTGLELRLGISSDNDSGGGGEDPWLGVGVHPWSLASRQEKAAMEQAAHQRPPPQPVGWPPVGAFRKSHLAGGAKAAEEQSKAKPGSGERSMFVKVNLEGCGVGRKVDLRAHRGYASLSRALQGMFHGFLSDGQWRIAAGREEEDGDDDEWQRQKPELGKKAPKNRKTYILLYEDNEGDRMLVGDVPWELFMASVKRLYIAHDPRKK
ncbi:unnamed protein product [Urochloa humidicola]